MSKALIALTFFMASAFALADDAKVSITSFNYTDMPHTAGQHTAELCGKVDGATQFPKFVTVTADPKSKSPGIYNAVVGSNQSFCVVLTTYTGEADAEVMK